MLKCGKPVRLLLRHGFEGGDVFLSPSTLIRDPPQKSQTTSLSCNRTTAYFWPGAAAGVSGRRVVGQNTPAMAVTDPEQSSGKSARGMG